MSIQGSDMERCEEHGTYYEHGSKCPQCEAKRVFEEYSGRLFALRAGNQLAPKFETTAAQYLAQASFAELEMRALAHLTDAFSKEFPHRAPTVLGDEVTWKQVSDLTAFEAFCRGYMTRISDEEKSDGHC